MFIETEILGKASQMMQNCTNEPMMMHWLYHEAMAKR